MIWKEKDETDNFAQKHDSDIIKASKRREIEAEVKVQLVSILKDELTNLKLSTEKDAGKGKKKDKSSAGKKGKKDGKGGKKEKDNGPVEPLLEELLQAGIIQKVETQCRVLQSLLTMINTVPTQPAEVHMTDFKGDQRLVPNDAPATYNLGDVNKLIMEACVIPLAYPNPESAVNSPCSVLLFGAKGTGKRMLVNAIAAETGAILFNITPRVIGQSANPAKTMATVFKAAKMVAPAVIYMNDAETVFAKKMGKDEPYDGRKLKKDYLKCLKALSPADNVLVVGCSSKPWEADAKVLQAVYQRCIFVPRADYGSRNVLWNHGIVSRGGKMTSALNVETLSRLSDGCTGGDIVYVCEKLLTARRLKMVRAAFRGCRASFLTRVASYTLDADKAAHQHGVSQGAIDDAACESSRRAVVRGMCGRV